MVFGIELSSEGQQTKEALRKKIIIKQGTSNSKDRQDHLGMTALGQESKTKLDKKVQLNIAKGLITPSNN